MTPEQSGKNESDSKLRQVTQDSMNSSVNMGGKPAPASLSFKFDNKPADPVDEDASLSFDFDKKPDDQVDKAVVKKETVSRPVEEPAPESVPDPEPSSGSASANEPEAAPEAKSAPKQYGLPEDYSREAERVTSKAGGAAPQSGSSTSAALDSAKLFIKKKWNDRQRAAKAAKAAAAERRRLAAIEQAAAEEKRKQIAAEQAAAKAAREAEAEYQAKLDAAVEAEKAANQKPANTKKAVKPQKNIKQAATGKIKTAGGSLKEKNAAAKAAAAKTAAAKSAASNDVKKTADKGSKQAVSSKAVKGNKGSKSGKAKKKKEKRPRKLWVRIVVGFIEIMIALGIIGGLAGVGYAAYVIAHADPINPNQIYNTLEVSTHIYDDQGTLTDDIYLSENREIVKYEQLPENLKNAFIAVEDKTFWTHKGFNIKRIFGAIWNSVSGGGEISGTSTITQQLARNVFLPEEKSIRSIKRKIIEMYYAHEIEETLSKEEILTAYLNTIYLGYGCYGVDTAAKKYFGKEVEDLYLSECAALAALPQAPGVYALLMTEDDGAETTTDLGNGLYANDVSQSRRYMVLDLMADQGYITAEKAEKAKKPLTKMINPGGASMSSSSSFKDYLLDTVKNDLMTQYNISAEQADKMIYTKGLEIYSTLDSQAQRAITKQFKKKSNFPSAVSDDGKVEAAMVIVEVGTGEIKAMAGTRKTTGEKLFNRAVSPRQPGSSIKPLAVYAPALQKSLEYQKEGKYFQFKDTGYDSQGTKYWGNYITASSGVTDERMTVNGQTWPQNFSRSYTGYKTFRQAIQLSINTCAVKILSQVGVDYSMDMVKKFGISTVIDDTSEPYNDVNLAALGLGAMTEGVTPLDMALAYAVFPNGGVHNSGICYTKVTDSEGKVLLEGKSERTRVLDKGVAFIMTDVLQTVVSDGIAGNAAISGERVGGKTGTTDETWDIWFDGFTANYAAALWIGTDNNVELNSTSATAASLWSKIMSDVKRAKGGTYKSQPSNVIVKNGEYYTTGTQPPDPPKEETKDKDKDKKSDKDSKDSKKDSGDKKDSGSDSKKEDKKD